MPSTTDALSAPLAPAVRIDSLEVVSVGAGHWQLSTPRTSGTVVEVIYLVAGSAELSGEPPVLNAGELTVIAEGRGVRADVAEGAELIIVRIPESAAGPHLHALRGAAGRVLAAGQGTTGLVAHLLRGLVAQGERCTDHPARLAQHVVGLIGLMCLDARDAEAGWRSELLRDALEFIEDHLAELDLTPDRIAAAQNISTRTLHRLFEGEDLTLGAWIRARRLEHCRAELADPAHAATSVSAIGARWGLWDAAHFSRLFKATFGASPRVYRQNALGERMRQTA